jgi:hypothetical protein
MRALIWLLALCLVPFFGCVSSAAAAGPAKLPGALPVIDAADYPSIQAAIDALGEKGGLVRLPPGEFVIDQPLFIRRSDVRVEGSGSATHIKNVNTEGKPAIVIEAVPNADPKDRRQPKLWRVMLSNFRLTGNDKSGHGVVAMGVNELFLQGLSISHHGGDGVHCQYCYEDMRLSDCLITYNKQAGLHAVGNHDTIINANQFEENQDAVRYLDGFNLCMTGNNIDDHLRHGVVIENTYGSIVSGNMIEECQGTAVILDRDCYGIAVSANVIAHHRQGGVDLRDAHGCSVSANAFPLVKQFGVRVGKDSARLAITGNSFGDSFLGDGKFKRTGGNAGETDSNESGGVVLESTRDVVITANTFTGVKPKALSIDGVCERITFTANAIAGSPSDHDRLQPPSLGTGNTTGPSPANHPPPPKAPAKSK